MDKKKDREEGYYWIRESGGFWVIAKWDGNMFRWLEDKSRRSSIDVEVDERRIHKPKD